MVKGVRWHFGNSGIGGCSNDCVRIEKLDSDPGRLLVEDTNGSDRLLNIRHWSTLIEHRGDRLALWEAAGDVYADIIKQLHSLYRKSALFYLSVY